MNNRIPVIRMRNSSDVIVAKHPEERIPFGSVLEVSPSQKALFCRNGELIAEFDAGRHILNGEMPFFDRAVSRGFLRGGNITECSVYFVNMSLLDSCNWGVGDIYARDRFYDLNIRMGAHGSYRLKVINAHDVLVNLCGMDDLLTTEDVRSIHTEYITAPIARCIHTIVTSEGLSLLTANFCETDISRAIQLYGNQELVRLDQGLSIVQFSTRLCPDEDTMNYVDCIERGRLGRRMDGYTWQEEKAHKERMKEIEVTRQYLLRTDPSLAENDIMRRPDALYLYSLLRNGGYGWQH